MNHVSDAPILSEALTAGDWTRPVTVSGNCGLTRAEHRRLAELLIRAARDGRAIAPFTQAYPEMTLADANSVRDMTIKHRLAQGERIVGAKLSDLDSGDVGWFTDHMMQSLGTVDPAPLIAPRLEAKLAVRLSQPVARPPTRLADLLGVEGDLAPCLEIVDSRFHPLSGDPRDAVADNCSTARIVLCPDVQTAGLRTGRHTEPLLCLARRICDEKGGIAAGTLLVGPPLGVGRSLRAGDVIDAGLAERTLLEVTA